MTIFLGIYHLSLLLVYVIRCVWLVHDIFLFYILNRRLKEMFLVWQFASPLMLNGN